MGFLSSSLSIVDNENVNGTYFPTPSDAGNHHIFNYVFELKEFAATNAKSRAEGIDMTDHENRLNGLFLKRRVLSTSCF